MPNPDGTQTAAERQMALMATSGYTGTANNSAAGKSSLSTDPRTTLYDKNGVMLPGSHGADGSLTVQNELYGNLSDAEALAKREGDFGLGTNNNAATAAMLGNAQATGDKYSSAFGADATNAGALSAAAGARGTQMYGGNTAAYSAGLGAAQQDRGMQTGAYGALMNFANQGPGDSAAQAQLAQATGANTQNALALARSGRGMGGSAAGLRQAMAQNAVTQQSAAGQAAELRANENTAYQAQRLSAMGQAGGIAGQTVQGDQGTAASGLSGAQYATNTALQGTQLNDAASQAWAMQQQQAQQQGLGAEVGSQTQQLNVNASALAGRESNWASANQEHATDAGVSTQAGIADANRQQAYVGAGVSAAGGVIAAASDERVKTNITPLGGGQVQPLGNQAPAQSASAEAASSPQGPTNAQKDQAQSQATGGTVGQVGGAAVGTVVGGPVGGAIGSVIGKYAGSKIGGLVGSDIRSKDNVRPLSYRGDDRPDYGDRDSDSGLPPLSVRDPNNPSQRISPYASAWQSSETAGRKDSYDALLSLAEKHGVATATDQKDVAKYAAIPAKRFPGDIVDPWAKDEQRDSGADAVGAGLSAAGDSLSPGTSGRSYQRFARGDHPILSEGDKLLADSARNAPGSMYEYKDPSDGAGTYTGPMAQDLARHPVTRGVVGQDPNSGKLYVDAARAALTGMAQNHSQQNQLDALDAKINSVRGLLSGSSPYATPTGPDTDSLDDARKRYPRAAL